MSDHGDLSFGETLKRVALMHYLAHSMFCMLLAPVDTVGKQKYVLEDGDSGLYFVNNLYRSCCSYSTCYSEEMWKRNETGAFVDN